MRRGLFILVGACATALASAPVVAAPGDVYEEGAAPETSSERLPVRMSVDTEKLGKEAQSTRDWVLRDGGAALEEAGLQVGEEAEAPEVRVSVEPKELGYAVVVEIWEAGAEAAAVRRGPKVCDSCTRSELLELVRSELLFAGGWLAGSPAVEQPADAPAEESEEPDDIAKLEAEPSPEDGDQPRRKLHALGWSGVGVGAFGVASLTGGLVVALRNYEARGEPGDYQVPSLERPQRVGWALVGVGVAAMVGGAVMVVLDLRRSRADAKSKTLSAGPWLDHQTGGLWVRRRF